MLCSDLQNSAEICKHVSMQNCSLTDTQPAINEPKLNLLSNLTFMFRYRRLILDRKWGDQMTLVKDIQGKSNNFIIQGENKSCRRKLCFSTFVFLSDILEMSLVKYIYPSLLPFLLFISKLPPLPTRVFHSPYTQAESNISRTHQVYQNLLHE